MVSRLVSCVLRHINPGRLFNTKFCKNIQNKCTHTHTHIYIKIGGSTKRFVFFEFIHLFILFLHTCMFPACCFRQRTYMPQSLVNGVLNVTWTHLCLQFEWFSVECSPMARKTGVQSQVELNQRLKKWYLIPPCLTLSIIRYVSRVKWSNPRKGVAPSPTPWCSSYSKGSFRVALDYSC